VPWARSLCVCWASRPPVLSPPPSRLSAELLRTTLFVMCHSAKHKPGDQAGASNLYPERGARVRVRDEWVTREEMICYTKTRGGDREAERTKVAAPQRHR